MISLILIIKILSIGNTRVITQAALQTFQDEMGKAVDNPYKVIECLTMMPHYEGLPFQLL